MMTEGEVVLRSIYRLRNTRLVDQLPATRVRMDESSYGCLRDYLFSPPMRAHVEEDAKLTHVAGLRIEVVGAPEYLEVVA